MKKKGALFYVIDALVATAIIVVTMTIIFNTKVQVQDSTIAEEAISNYIILLSNRQISSLIGLPVTNRLILDRSITNPSSTIFEAVVELVENDRIENASALMKEASDIILDPQYSMRVSIIKGSDKTLVFEKSVRKKEKANIDLSRQQAISFKQEKFVELSTKEIYSGMTGDDACSPAKCLYLINSSETPFDPDIPHAFKLKACSATGQMHWFAHCRYEKDTALIGPVLVEVELWI